MIWLTKKEAAEYLRVCVSTIDNLESKGLILGKRLYLGKRKPIVRYHVKDLDGMFEATAKGRPNANKRKKQ